MSDSIHVPGGHGRAFHAPNGARITAIDVMGKQALDFVAFNADDLGETLSGVETRRALLSLYIRTGDILYSSRGRPMLALVEDPIRVHDYTIPACDDSRFALGRSDNRCTSSSSTSRTEYPGRN